jgi:hypothetical protein
VNRDFWTDDLPYYAWWVGVVILFIVFVVAGVGLVVSQ